MTAVERYLAELGGVLHTRGRARRRLLDECRDHLTDAAAVHGDEKAVELFGSAPDLARSFDIEVAVRRATRGALAAVLAVLAVGASTIALLDGADHAASAVTAWAVLFFAGAQSAIVCVILTVVQAVAIRHRPGDPDDVRVLCRRAAAALASSAVTLLAAGGAVPGHATAWVLAVGPVVVVLALLRIGRTRRLAAALGGPGPVGLRPPLVDLLTVVGRLDVEVVRAVHRPWRGLLLPWAAITTLATFGWDHLDHGSLASSLTAAGTEAALVVAGFVLLGPVLGLVRLRGVGPT